MFKRCAFCKLLIMPTSVQRKTKRERKREREGKREKERQNIRRGGVRRRGALG